MKANHKTATKLALLGSLLITGCQSNSKQAPPSPTYTHHTQTQETQIMTARLDKDRNVIKGSQQSKKSDVTADYDVDENGIVRNVHLRGKDVPKILR